jgi:hypothetical protein
MKRRFPPSADSYPVRAAVQRSADEFLREIASSSHVAEHHVAEEIGDAAVRTLMALPAEKRAHVALGAFKRLQGGMSVDDVTAWLAIKVREQRTAFEAEAKKASIAKAAHERGAAASVAQRRAPWDAWRGWICEHFGVSDTTKVQPEDRRSIVEVIVYRTRAKGHRPSLDDAVPKLPVPKGRERNPPSDDSIRRNLFGTRAK